MTNTWDLINKSTNLSKSKVKQILGSRIKNKTKLQPSVKSTTYTLKSHIKPHLLSEHPSQTPTSKPTFFLKAI